MRLRALARVDDAVVPQLQRTAAATARRVGWPARLLAAIDARVAGGRLARGLFLRRRVVALLAVIVALAGTAVHFERFDEIEQRLADEQSARREQTVRIPGAALPGFELVGDVTAHGPRRGSDPGDWVEERSAVLADLGPGSHAAMISLEGYRSASDVAALLVDVTPLRAQYRLPDVSASPLETEIVAADLEASMTRVVEEALRDIRDEEAALQELLDSGTIQDPAFEADNRNRLEELRAVRNVLELTGEVVFAVVVEGDAAALQALGRREAIRLVDPLPEGADPSTVSVFGLLPDDRDEVTFGKGS